MRVPTILLLAALLAQPAPGRESKLDPPVENALRGDTPIPVIILGKTQLLLGPGAFEEFCEANDRRKRSELRAGTIERLREIAAPEQERVLEALGRPEDARTLWIINAVFATVEPELLRKVAALDEVRYVYSGSRLPAIGDPGKVPDVLEPAERPKLRTKGKKIPWNLKAIGADRVWSKLDVTGEGAVVAMFDAGVRITHEDLRGNVWINEDEVPNNGKDDDGNGLVDDLHGFDFARMKADVSPAGGRPGREHGTMTAGIVAGDGTGGTITGVAPRARILPVRGAGIWGAGRVFEYCLENGADIVNMSFSQPNLKNLRGLWRLMADQATAGGLVLVSGAGNFQKTQKIPVQMRIPEGIPSVICAGGVDEELNVPGFCSLGPVEWASVKFYEDYPMPAGLVKPDVCGFPGPRFPILAAKPKGYFDPNPNIQGNSFSGPHVSGVAALMLSARPELPAWKVKEILEETARDIAPKGKDVRTGAGLVDAYAAVKAARRAGSF